MSGLGQVKFRDKELAPGLLLTWKEPSYLNHHHCLPGTAVTGSCSQELKPSPGVSVCDGGVLIRLNACFWFVLDFTIFFFHLFPKSM